jgi:hypothetical protein
VTIDRRSNRLDDVHSNAGSLGELANLLLVLVGQVDNVFITESLEVVDFNVGLEYREAMADIREVVKPVNVNTSNFNFITRTSCVN